MNSLPIQYRLGAADPASYYALFQLTGWRIADCVTLESLTESLTGSWRVLSAWDGDRLAGTGRIVSDGSLYAMIYDLIVHPAYRRQGIGGVILSRLIQEAKNSGIQEVQLFSAAGKTEFYQNRGFEIRPGEAPGMQLRQETNELPRRKQTGYH